MYLIRSLSLSLSKHTATDDVNRFSYNITLYDHCTMLETVKKLQNLD